MKALIELIERDGRPGRVIDVHQWPVSLGRALDNDVVLDDPHVAPHHAQLVTDEHGQHLLLVGDSINGVTMQGVRYGAGQQVPLPPQGARLQVGGVTLRLRLPAETLAPERPLATTAAGHGASAWLAAVLVAALALANHWVGLDPGADTSAWLPLAVGLPVAVASWCGLWALASKLFQHRFEFLEHLRIVLPWLLGIEALDALLTPLAAGLGWAWLWRLVSPLQLLLALLMLRAHLTQLLPQSGRTVTAALAAAGLAGAAISLALTQRATDRYSRPPYMSTLPLPALNLASPVPAAELAQDLAPLAAQLARRVQQAREEDAEGGEDAGN